MDSLLPFLQGFFLPYNMSVYPGALRFAGHSGVSGSSNMTKPLWSLLVAHGRLPNTALVEAYPRQQLLEPGV